MVGGIVEGKYTGVRNVHSMADIEAKIWHSKKEEASLKQHVRKRTGNSEKKYGIKFNNFSINFYKTLSKFEKYDTINENKKIKLFSNLYLPIEILKNTNYECEYEDITYTEDELVDITVNKLEEELKQKISENSILNKQVNLYKGKGYIEVEVIIETLEKIGKKQKI